jgi:ABC-type uncharacterized transport system permease subunit
MNAPALWLSFRLGARRGWAEKAGIVGQCAILWALIVSYGVLFRFIPPAVLTRLHLTPAQLIWYLVFTEIITFVNVSQFRILQDEIREGSMEIRLLRPMEFWPLQLAEWLGDGMGRLAICGTFGLILGFGLSGEWPRFISLLLLIPIWFLSALIALSVHLVVGCTTLWLGECRPLYWTWQKAMFLLGALVIPLSFYPAFLQKSVWLTPFPAMLAIAGNLALTQTGGQIALQVLAQLFWVGVGLFLCRTIAQAVRHKFQRGG